MGATERSLRSGKASPPSMASMHTTDCSVRTGPGARTAPIPWKAQAEIVIPVRNEERDLGPAVRRLRAYCDDCFPFTARITIADNGSTDRTWARAQDLANELPLVRAARIERPSRGGALRSIWSGSDADVVAYMDVDLSTDLSALLPLVAPLVSGHSDVAIGTRLARGSRVVRGPKREIVSRCYNLLLHASLGTRFSDAQCGFKAVRADAAQSLLPLTTDTGWFFDTELLVLAERAGLRIHEIPVDWIDDPDSRVNLVATALGDLRGILRLGTGLARGTIVVPELRGAQPQPPGEYADRRPRRAGWRHGRGPRGWPGQGRPASRRPAGELRPDRRGQHRGLCAAVPAPARRRGRAGRQRHQPAADRRGQHRGQPAGDVRHPGPAACRAASGARPDRVRHRPRAHLRRPGRPARQHPPGRAHRRAHRARGGQPDGHAGAFRPLPHLGLPPSPGIVSTPPPGTVAGRSLP